MAIAELEKKPLGKVPKATAGFRGGGRRSYPDERDSCVALGAGRLNLFLPAFGLIVGPPPVRTRRQTWLGEPGRR